MQRSMRPAHDFVMASEYVELARIHRALREVPPRYLVALKTDCLVGGSDKAAPPGRHPKYRFEEVKRLEGEYQEPRLETEPPTEQEPWRHVEDPVEHCLNGHSLLLSGMPGTGKTHLARQIRGSGVADAEGLSAAARLGGHELTENRRSDERIFRFQYLRVDEAEQVPLRDAVQVAREQFPRRGLPDNWLVISHAHRMAINDRENRRLAPEGAVLLEHRAQGSAGSTI